ncbi:MAG: SDR family oxidoreductase [Roseitalea sp.]|jgi:uncharacterized protein YbjT (DUF2867 family)|nr:SDR family oxidoreductase [Roseitalea sp.]MBO6721434.1 SDR family oxidoreductase [Roseitalea sp.]MBO6744619.1 SDR family oxidoreductase [Roseitalea sp.]
MADDPERGVPAKAIVLGGGGFIGSGCVRALAQAGFRVTAVGRSRPKRLAGVATARWRTFDMTKADAGGWADLLADADVVVNAAGALQDGAGDDLTAIHETAVAAMVDAIGAKAVRIIQISAAGVSNDATTAFMRTKSRGDAVLMASGLDWVVLRPSIVIGADAYGGTALLRAAAGVPWVEPRILATVPVQTAALADVADAVVAAARGVIETHTLADLTEPEARAFGETVRMIRSWLGLPAWRLSMPVPKSLVLALSFAADGLGRLGWRSPLRSTAIKTLEAGVTADPSAWIGAGGKPFRPLGETLAAMPATAQERWFARLYLLLPVLVGSLSAFWLLTGLIALWQREASVALLAGRGVSDGFANLVVIGGSVLDIALGAMILVRRWARHACLGMVAVSLLYLIGGTVVAADLWADPLGPLLKILPAALLPLVTATLLADR